MESPCEYMNIVEIFFNLKMWKRLWNIENVYNWHLFDSITLVCRNIFKICFLKILVKFRDPLECLFPLSLHSALESYSL